MLGYLRRSALRNLVLMIAFLAPLAVLYGKSLNAWGLKLQQLWKQNAPAWFAASTDRNSTLDDASPGALISTSGRLDAASGSWGAANTAPSTAPPPTSWIALPEVFRFDQDRAAITKRWPRVTSVPTPSNLRGLRAALVTGTAPHDLAGSVTYFFDPENVMQRIAFDGVTHDPAPLVQFLTQAFRLEPSPGSIDFYLSRPVYPLSAVYVERAAVIRQGPAPETVRVTVELNRPYKAQRLSPWFTQLLEEKGLLAPSGSAASSSSSSSAGSPPPASNPNPSATYVPPRGASYSTPPPPASQPPSTWAGVPVVHPSDGYRTTPVN